MIASNYRKFPDAVNAQRELDLSGTVGTKAQSAAWWAWIMEAGKALAAPKIVVPGWFKAASRMAKALARSVEEACLHLIAAD